MESLSAVYAVGDVQALRSEDELAMVHMPDKYRQLGDFELVSSGKLRFPGRGLLFIGGNHEPWKALDANRGLASGGGRWADQVTYLGRSGVVTVSGLTVAFLSGIYSEKVSPGTARSRPDADSDKNDRKRRNYYTSDELAALMNVVARKKVDVVLTHDWPSGLYEDERSGAVGDPRVRTLIERANPKLSCHGHMHFAFSSTIADTNVECLGHANTGADQVKIFVKRGTRILRLA